MSASVPVPVRIRKATVQSEETVAQSEGGTCPRLYGATWCPGCPLSHCAVVPFSQGKLPHDESKWYRVHLPAMSKPCAGAKHPGEGWLRGKDNTPARSRVRFLQLKFHRAHRNAHGATMCAQLLFLKDHLSASHIILPFQRRLPHLSRELFFLRTDGNIFISNYNEEIVTSTLCLHV